ncbi:alpha-2-macroglobulin family protein, partial [Klebsiella pneumoniae]|nr:alpha-2-macroglobulin family protein [Klebsiella pneumoniae]
MKPFRLAALSLALLTAFSLTGCDDSGTPQASAPAPAADSNPGATAKPDRAQLAALAEKSQGKALTLLDASEVQLDGAATLVLTFSVPLQPDQDFSRSVHLVDKKSGKVDGAWELAPNLKELRLRHLEPKRELIVSVDPTLTALNKATLDKPFEKTLTTRDIAPSVGFASRGSLLPGNVVAGLPVMALNVDNVDVNFFRIKPESLSAFVSQWEYRNSLSNWESDELLKMADLVYSGRFDLNPARNTREKLLLPLSDIKPLQQPGVYVAVMNPAGRYSYSNAATLFTLSDIGVSAHRYHNRLDVFTQSLENGAVQSGIE